MPFCPKPLLHLEIVPGGNCFICCSGWQPTIVGNILRDSIDKMWNSPLANDIRVATMKGDWKYCTSCPYIETLKATGNVIGPVKEAFINSNIPLFHKFPTYINFAYDRSCNLSCPTCRQSVIVADGLPRLEIERISQLLLDDPSFIYVREIWVTGSGDPFASKTYREMLRNLPDTEFPKVTLHTNGLLFKSGWASLPEHVRARVHVVDMSIDAATPATYHENRRGGRWEDMLENLFFIGELRRRGPVKRFSTNFVVQANNFREMAAFVELSAANYVDRVAIKPLRNWGTFGMVDLAHRTITDVNHTLHAEFLKEVERAKAVSPIAEVCVA